MGLGTEYLNKEDELILVDQDDNAIGSLSKLAAHQQGLLHRAFSLFVFNQDGEVLLQQRAMGKYHSAGLWTNTCCSHPRPGELTGSAVQRRLHEEMGLQCEVEFQFSFTYRFEFENGLIEHEIDHIYIGHSDQPPVPNPDEVMAWRYTSLEDLQNEVGQRPEEFTVWLRLCLPDVIASFRSSKKLK